MSFLSELGLRNLKAHKHAQEFRNTFNRGLPDFWHPIFGFDIVKFDDEVVKSPDGKSCSKVPAQEMGR